MRIKYKTQRLNSKVILTVMKMMMDITITTSSFALIWTSVCLSFDLIVLFLILLPHSENALKRNDV